MQCTNYWHLTNHQSPSAFSGHYPLNVRCPCQDTEGSLLPTISVLMTSPWVQMAGSLSVTNHYLIIRSYYNRPTNQVDKFAKSIPDSSINPRATHGHTLRMPCMRVGRLMNKASLFSTRYKRRPSGRFNIPLGMSDNWNCIGTYKMTSLMPPIYILDSIRLLDFSSLINLAVKQKDRGQTGWEDIYAFINPAIGKALHVDILQRVVERFHKHIRFDVHTLPETKSPLTLPFSIQREILTLVLTHPLQNLMWHGQESAQTLLLQSTCISPPG